MQPNTTIEELWSTEQARAYVKQFIKVGENAWYDAVHKGQIPSIKFRRNLSYKKSEIDKWLVSINAIATPAPEQPIAQ